MKVFKIILLLTVLSIIYNILGVIVWYQHRYLVFLMLIATFIISYFIFTKTALKYRFKVSLLFVLPFILLSFLSCLYYRDFSRGLPYIVFVPLSTYLAHLALKTSKIWISIFSFFLFTLISFFIFPNFFVYYHNHNAEKNILFTDIKLVNKKNQEITLNQNKIVVLDFWSTNCGICFEKFPDLQKTFTKFKDNKNVEIISVNVPIRNDKFEKTTTILDSIGYTFPMLYAKSFDEVETNLKFNTFPHLIIIKEGRIRYDGYLITNDESKLYNIDDEINKLLDE